MVKNIFHEYTNIFEPKNVYVEYQMDFFEYKKQCLFTRMTFWWTIITANMYNVHMYT